MTRRIFQTKCTLTICKGGEDVRLIDSDALYDAIGIPKTTMMTVMVVRLKLTALATVTQRTTLNTQNRLKNTS